MSRKMNTNSPSLPSSQRDFDPLLFEASLNPLVMKEAVLLALVDARPGVQVREGGKEGGRKGGREGGCATIYVFRVSYAIIFSSPIK